MNDQSVEDSLLSELSALPDSPGPGRAPACITNSAAWSTACRSGKLNYTHKAAIDLIISQPGISQRAIAAAFGYTEAWFSNIMASDAFKVQLEARREEIVDPIIKASVKENIEALARQSLVVLLRKLDQPQVSDTLALKALELGAKAMGLGGNAPPVAVQVNPRRLEELGERLLNLLPKPQGPIYDVEPLP